MNSSIGNSLHLSATQAAILEGIPVRTMQDRCKKNKYHFDTLAENGIVQYRVHLSSLTTQAQAKYWVQQYHDTLLPDAPREQRENWLIALKLETDVFKLVYRQTGLNISVLAWSDEESEKRNDVLFHAKDFAKKEARRRARLVHGFLSAKRYAKGNATPAARAYAAENEVSYSTLSSWCKLVKHLPHKNWEAALVPGWKGGRKQVDIHPQVWEQIESRYLVESQPKAKTVYQQACRWAEKRGMDVPSYRIVLARLNGIDLRVRTLKREGETAFNQMFPGIVRDWSTIELHEMWNADGRKADVMTTWYDGDVVRPVCLAWIDLRSRMVLGVSFDKGENVDLVRKSYRAAVEHAGCLPHHAYLDNGAAFASKEFTGGQTKRNRFKVKPTEVEGMLTLTGVDVIWATPGHGQAKPIESFWNTLARGVDQRAEFVKAYCGKDTVSRPEGSNPNQNPIPIADYIAAVNEEIEAYNLREHRGKGMDGKSPMQVYTELQEKTILRTPSKEQMRWCMLVAQSVTLSKRDRSFTINGNVYWHEDLAKLDSTGPYTARYDGDDSKVPVQIFDGETYICAAELRMAIGARNLAAAKDGIRADKQAKRAVKDLAKAITKKQKAAAWNVETPPAAPDAPDLPVGTVVTPLRASKNLKPTKREPVPDVQGNPYLTPEMEANRERYMARMGR